MHEGMHMACLNLNVVGGEGELQENFEKDVLF